MNDQQIHVSAGMTTRASRKAAKKRALELEKALIAEHNRAKQLAVKESKAAQEYVSQIPAAGEKGEWAMRQPFRASLLPHRDTSGTIAALYPFISDGGLGVGGALVGQDAYSLEAFQFDPWMLYQAGIIHNPNWVISGDIGAGKSSTAKAMIVRSMLYGRKATIASDPKGEWTPLTRALGGSVIRIAPGTQTRINPLDSGARPQRNADGGYLTDSQWATIERSSRLSLIGAIVDSLLPVPMNPNERAALDHAVDMVVAQTNNHPRLPEVVHQLLEPPTDGVLPPGFTYAQLKDDSRMSGNALRRLTHGDLAGLFDDYSTVTFDSRALITTIDLSALGVNHPGIHLAQTCASAWVESAVRDNSGPRWMAYDESWNIMTHIALVRRLQEQWKLSRHYGLSNGLILHRYSDLAAAGESDSELRNLAQGILEDTDIRIIHRQKKSTLESTVADTGMSEAEASMLSDLDQGVALWRIRNRPFVVRTLLHATELEMFDTNAAMVA